MNRGGFIANLIRSRRARTILLALALWVTFIYVRHENLGWNINSRLCLTFALVEQGTVRIDDYWQRPDFGTRDVATYGGHFYSDKVIGTSLLGVPAAAALRFVESMRGAPFSLSFRHWFVTAFSVALLAAAAGIVFFRLAHRYLRVLGLDDRGAEVWGMLTTMLTFCGTMLILYAGVFMPYLPAVFFLLLALQLIETNEPGGGEGGLSIQRAFWIGVCLGASILCDYLAGWPALCLLVFMISRDKNVAKGLAGIGGIIIGVSPFLLYCYVIFGNLSIPYEYEVETFFRESMSKGFMGATVPKLTVAYLLAFHPYRGMFYHSPHLLLGFVGPLNSWKTDPLWRPRAALFLCVFLGLFVYVSAYYMWWGGWALAPRLLAVAVPFLALSSVPVLGQWWGRLVALVLAAWSVFVHFVMLFMPPNFPDRPHGAPLASLLDPDFSRYEYPALFLRYVLPKFRLGETEWSFSDLLHLTGMTKLLPLVIVWAAVVLAFSCLRRHRSGANGGVTEGR